MKPFLNYNRAREAGWAGPFAFRPPEANLVTTGFRPPANGPWFVQDTCTDPSSSEKQVKLVTGVTIGWEESIL